MVCRWALSAALLAAILAPGAGFGFSVEAGKRQCFDELAKASERIAGEWRVLSGGALDLDVKESDRLRYARTLASQNAVLPSGMCERRDGPPLLMHRFTASTPSPWCVPQPHSHEILRCCCRSPARLVNTSTLPSMRRRGRLRSMRQMRGPTSFASRMNVKCRRVALSKHPHWLCVLSGKEGYCWCDRREGKSMPRSSSAKLDEARQKMTTSTRRWLLWFTILEAFVLVAVSLWQILYLKSFFEVRRVV
eukprot:scaffold245098_cov31-Tisochrysis_lutea.AAC.1